MNFFFKRMVQMEAACQLSLAEVWILVLQNHRLDLEGSTMSPTQALQYPFRGGLLGSWFFMILLFTFSMPLSFSCIQMCALLGCSLGWFIILYHILKICVIVCSIIWTPYDYFRKGKRKELIPWNSISEVMNVSCLLTSKLI